MKGWEGSAKEQAWGSTGKGGAMSRPGRYAAQCRTPDGSGAMSHPERYAAEWVRSGVTDARRSSGTEGVRRSLLA